MKHPRRAARDPLQGAALAVRQSRPGGALGWTASCDAGGAPAPSKADRPPPPRRHPLDSALLTVLMGVALTAVLAALLRLLGGA